MGVLEQESAEVVVDPLASWQGFSRSGPYEWRVRVERTTTRKGWRPRIRELSPLHLQSRARGSGQALPSPVNLRQWWRRSTGSCLSWRIRVRVVCQVILFVKHVVSLDLRAEHKRTV